MINPVIPETKEENAPVKPLLNIQLPAPMNGDPNAPLSVGKFNASSLHNFQEVGNVLLTIINNQKIMGMAIKLITDKQQELEKSVGLVSEGIRKFIKENDNESTNTKPKSAN
jgi:hypothetical protein